MPLTDQGRKLLWGRAGGRCAICQRLLTADEADPEPAVVVGEECHVVSPRPGGPRYRPLAPSEVDAYDNLVLLCPSDHETVDKQPLHYTEERLHEIKREHEAWVCDSSLSFRAFAFAATDHPKPSSSGSSCPVAS
jgi:hypothetical protein